MKVNALALTAISALVIGATIGCSRQDELAGGDFVYKIETGGVLAGYAVMDTFLVVEGGEDLIRLEQRSHFEAKLLGADVTSESRLAFIMEPEGKRVRSHAGESRAGPNSANWSMERRDGQILYSSSFKKDSLVFDMPPDVIVENTLFLDHVVADFTGTGLSEKTYRVFDIADLEVRDTRFEKHGEEMLELAGTTYAVIVVDKSIAATGVLVRLWIDTETAMVLRVLEQDGNVISLADPSVMGKVERVDMDKYIFDKTNVAIADVTGITYMKVRAKIRPVGLQLAPELLNVPGQKFTGTVANNLIEGVFEIEHVPYEGAEAPPFPVAATDPALAEYLAADGIFETDDDVLIAKAREITADATDSWEAATRLATWVSDEINYAIPGGGTARKTYEIRAGECGAHSVLLATFCRAVGIPARMVWGCMYTPNYGGSFGQHGWTEVHMGAAGWIPVDATVGETDYVDSGHIRIAHFGSLISRLNAQEFEILDYRVAGGGGEASAAAEARFAPYLGRYEQTGSSQEAEIEVMDGGLVVGLPGKAMLAIDDPDETGRWVCKLAKHVHVTFARTETIGTGEVASFTLYERHSLPRRSAPETAGNDAPSGVVPYLGAYHLAALAADFTVSWERGRLTLRHPQVDRAFPLTPADEDGVWRTANGPFAISFVNGENGEVESLTLVSASEFKRK